MTILGIYSIVAVGFSIANQLWYRGDSGYGAGILDVALQAVKEGCDRPESNASFFVACLAPKALTEFRHRYIVLRRAER